MSGFNLLQNADLLSVGVAIAAIGILGFVIYLNNRESITGKSFLLFAVVTICWSAVNYLSYHVPYPETALWILRFVMFFAVWHAFSLFQLFYVFPKDTVVFPPKYNWVLVPLVFAVSVVTLTPFLFEGIAELSSAGQITRVHNGPAIALFAIVVVGLIAGALYVLIKKFYASEGAERGQFRWVLSGTALTFALLVVFNFLLPAFFDNPRYIPLGPVFLLPFVVFTFYAIFQHKLFDIKVISTEIVVFFLVIAAFSQVLFAETVGETVFQAGVFALLFIFSILLIRSVMKEVKQREQLETLSKELAFANTKLKELDERKSEFLSFASHQLRTPLTAIKGYASMLLEGSFGAVGETFRKPLDAIFKSSDRLVAIIEDFLTISRIEQNRLVYNFEDADVRVLVGGIVEDFKEAAKEKNLALSFLAEEEGEYVARIDSGKIAQIVSNIIDNAIKYTPEGSVSVTLGRAGENTARIAVKDTGIGMDAAAKKKIFQKFSRADGAEKTSSSGTGLGLYVAKILIAAHKGRIWAESDGKDKGSTFFIELPLV